MSSFAKWLTDQDSSQQPDLKALQDLAKNPTTRWPFWANGLSAYLDALRAVTPPPANLSKLIDTLDDAYARWRQEGESGKTKTFWELVFSHLGIILPAVAVLIFMVGIVYGLANTDFYASLARTEQGRGLITFLFALTATGVILIIALGIFFYGDTDDLQKRITPAKDVLTVVIGVLGTIMGFYFGSSVDGRINIANVEMRSPAATAADKSIRLGARIVGGNGPFQYTISFGDAGLPAISKSTTNATIDEPLDNAKLAALKTVTVTIAVTDTKGIQASSTTLLIPPPQTQPQGGGGGTTGGGTSGGTTSGGTSGNTNSGTAGGATAPSETKK